MAGHSARTAGTPLQRQLAGTSPARPTALDGFRLARRTFLAGERIDMQTLARSLGVDRATLYRWVGSRERLLTEILWSLIEPTVTTLRQAETPVAAWISPAAAVIIGTVRGVMTNPGMQRFLEREGELALRLLTTKASDFETRLIALVGEMVRAEASAGRLDAAVPLDDLPYVLVRIMESYIYLGLITGEDPDPDRAARVISALLPRGAGPLSARRPAGDRRCRRPGAAPPAPATRLSEVAAGWRRRRERRSRAPR
jgi:AcrR family transcriptional regulator